MHDCRTAQEQLLDLIFEELGAAESRRLRDEIDLCPSCRAEYRAMSQSMKTFEQVAERVAPAEGFWPGYEARLRARLAEEASPGLWSRLMGWLGGFTLLPAPVSLAAAAALLALLLGGWWWMRQPGKAGEAPVIAGPGGKEIPPSPAPAPRNDLAKEGGNLPGPAPRPRRPIKARAGNPVRNEDVAAQFQPAVSALPFFTADATRHFEKAQLLLRAVRNADDGKASIDLTYEKRQSRGLLYQNILFRRDAEAKGNLPAEDVLGALEPLLLDIANLPDKPSRDDVREIKERIARQEMIAVLQPYAAMTTGAP